MSAATLAITEVNPASGSVFVIASYTGTAPAPFATVTGLDGQAWRDEFKLHDELFARLAERLPAALGETRRALEQRFASAC